MKYLRFIFIIISLFINICILFSSKIDNSVRFRSISTKDGLSENHINCIMQDKKGFIWIGTDGGLNRYDGYEFKKFFFDPLNDTILRSNIIQCIDEDADGNIWFGTPDRGYYKFNIETESFKYFGNTKENPDKYLNTAANWVKVTSDSSIWFSGLNGIDILMPKKDGSGEYKNYKFLSGIKKEDNIVINNLRSIQTDYKNRIWVGTNKGLYRAVRQSNLDVPYKLELVPELQGKVVYNIQPFNAYLFIALNDGVYRAEVLENGSFHIEKVIPYFLRKYSIDMKGNVVGGHDDGLYIFKYDPKKDIYLMPEIYNTRQNIAENISEDNITTTFIDKTGILWIGTNIMGLNIFDPGRKKIKLHHEIDNIQHLSNIAIRSVYQDKHNNIWVGTMGNGLYFKQGLKGKSDNEFIYVNDPKGDQYGHNTIFSFTECIVEGEEFLLIGMGYPFKLGYIKRKDYLKNNFKINQIRNFPSNVNDLITDSDGIVWASTYGNGLYRLYPESKGLNYWEKISAEQNGLSSTIIRSVYEDIGGNIWVATVNGLNLIRKSEKHKDEIQIEVFNHVSADGTGLNHNYTLPIHQSKDGRIWIGTMGGGVNILQMNNNGRYTFNYLTVKDGLPDNTIKGLLEDEDGNMWISSNKGISKYDIKTSEISNLSLSDGLQDYEYLDLSCFKTQDGELYFGGVKGLNSFYPSELKNNTVKAEPIITELQINNKIVNVNELINNRVILNKNISSTEEIDLYYSEKSINLTFSAIHFASPGKNKFKYRLVGFNDEWVLTDANNRTAKYTNLNAGEYTFELIVSNNDGIWNNDPVQLKINVKAPFWMSNVAKVFYAIVIMLIFVLFNRYSLISKTIKNKLIIEKMEKEKQEELSQMKLKLFTDISHEFRTPLTMIKGPVNQLMAKDEVLSKEQRSNLYNLVINSSNQILNLVNQLIDFRKTENGKMPLNVGYYDINEFLTDYTDCFLPWASQKEITLQYKALENRLMAWFDIDVLQKIMNNLLSNALKFTNTGGVIEVRLVVKEVPDQLITIEVKDDGVGIPQNVIPNIFERFYKANNSNQIGTGIGLSFVQSLVKLHHGDIYCESKLNEGSQFSFTFPINKNSYSDNEIAKEKVNVGINKESVYIPVEPQHNEPKKLKGGERKILVVDDNEGILTFIAQNLPSEFLCILAHNGEEGVEMALKENPDVIVSDIMMPVKDGFTLLKEVKSNPDTSHIPVILLSAKTTDDSKQQGYVVGADGFVEKPFNINVLVSQLNSINRNRKILQDKFRNQIKVEPKEITTSNKDAELVEKLVVFVEDNIENPDLKIDFLSSHVGMSGTKLNNKLKAITGLTTGAFVRSIRIKKAAQLLEKSEMSVSEIVYEIGFNDIKYFRTCFKKEFGLTPTDYRSEHKQ